MDFRDIFWNYYEQNLDTILRMRDLTSGTHKINEEKANLWIECQLSDRRKKACLNLINNTHYITFNELFEGVRELVTKVKHLSNKNPYLVTGFKNTSTYLMSIIFIYIWNLNDFGNINVISEIISPEILNIIKDNEIIMIDDFLYTGGQLYTHLSYIKNNSWRINFAELKINICVVGATNKSLLRLEKFNFKKYVSKIYDNLYDVLSIEEYVDLIYYFSPVNFHGSIISLYLDHKIADDVSTFLKVLQYGPILPTDLKYKDLVIDAMKENIIKDKKINIDLETYLKYMEEDESKIIYDEKSIKFIPFIEGCNNIPEIPNDMPYFSFILTPSFIDHINNNLNKTKSNYKDTQKFIKYMNLLDNPKNRCPKSWYKDNLL